MDVRAAAAEPDPRDAAGVRALHEARLAAAETARASAEVADARIANLRLAVAAVALAALFAAWRFDAVPWGVLLVPVALFVWLVVLHSRAARARRDAERRIELHQRGLSRLDGTWPGTGPDGARFADPAHPYCDHLDVFGRGSLFQLISAARTPQGEACLAAWLKQSAGADEVRRRQDAVRELRPRWDLREDIALIGANAATADRLAGLAAWGEAPEALSGPAVRALAWLLPLPTLVLAGLWAAGLVSAWWMLLSFLVGRAAIRQMTPRIEQVLAEVEAPARDLELLRGLLVRIEAETFESGALRDVAAALQVDGGAASSHIRALRRRITLGDARRNQMFAPVAMALLWELHIALALEDWRRTCGPRLAAWLEAVARFEALASLAGHAAEHPADPFPSFVADVPSFVTDVPSFVTAGPSFVADALAHPLLPETRAVPNDVRIDSERRIHVVSGSNMSGKSTFLRTVGANAVLALAGGTVRARALTLSPVTIGASIQVHDSLLDGESRFYAEVARIGRIVALGRGGQSHEGAPPLLFLLDELFHGTNSADRRAGAAAVVRALLAEGAAGLVTTHDLELARIAEDLDAHVVNVHFEDQYEGGRMTFDYRMRPGVVTRSNALALMRAVGLDV